MNHTSQKSNSPSGAGLLYRAGRREGIAGVPGEFSWRNLWEAGQRNSQPGAEPAEEKDPLGPGDGLGFGDWGEMATGLQMLLAWKDQAPPCPPPGSALASVVHSPRSHTGQPCLSPLPPEWIWCFFNGLP